MKSNELRIGNLVNVNSDMLSVTGADIAYFDFNGNDYSQILLTPEILEKAGFRHLAEGVYELSTETLSIAWDETGLDIAFEGNDIGYDLDHIKSLHQLQNLYFALTGEELPIEL